jgi:hypothetical protein
MSIGAANALYKTKRLVKGVLTKECHHLLCAIIDFICGGAGIPVVEYSDPICQDKFLPCLRWFLCRLV